MLWFSVRGDFQFISLTKKQLKSGDFGCDRQLRSIGIICQQQMEAGMVTRNVVLTQEQADLVERLVSSGRYQNASEALRAGLRLLEQEEGHVVELRERLMASFQQMERAQFADGDGKDVVRRAFSAARARQI